MSSSLEDLLAAARERQSPWDASRSERVLLQALTTRAARARSKATRFTVATACGAMLVMGFGIANGAGLVFAPPASASGPVHADATQEPSDAPQYKADNIDSQPPSASELAALARNDGGYGRD